MSTAAERKEARDKHLSVAQLRLLKKPNVTLKELTNAGIRPQRISRELPQRFPAPSQTPPTGTYDPNLNAEARNSRIGLGRTEQDTTLADSRAGTDLNVSLGDLLTGKNRNLEDIGNQRTDLTTGKNRNLEDLGLQEGDVNRAYGQNVEDTERNYGRSLSDLLTNRKRGGEDYQRDVGDLDRKFSILGNQQTQTARNAGVAAGGALAQALQKRQANQAYERKPLDTGFARFNEDSQGQESRLGEDKSTTLSRLLTAKDRDVQGIGISRGRVNEDYGTNTGRLDLSSKRVGEDYDRNVGATTLGYQRGVEDRSTTLGRTREDNLNFQQDIGASRIYQATGTGWKPKKPKKRDWARQVKTWSSSG